MAPAQHHLPDALKGCCHILPASRDGGRRLARSLALSLHKLAQCSEDLEAGVLPGQVFASKRLPPARQPQRRLAREHRHRLAAALALAELGLGRGVVLLEVAEQLFGQVHQALLPTLAHLV